MSFELLLDMKIYLAVWVPTQLITGLDFEPHFTLLPVPEQEVCPTRNDQQEIISVMMTWVY